MKLPKNFKTPGHEKWRGHCLKKWGGGAGWRGVEGKIWTTVKTTIKCNLKKRVFLPWPRWLSWLEHSVPWLKGSGVDHRSRCIRSMVCEHAWGNQLMFLPHTDVSLSLSPPPPSSLSESNEKMFLHEDKKKSLCFWSNNFYSQNLSCRDRDVYSVLCMRMLSQLCLQ